MTPATAPLQSTIFALEPFEITDAALGVQESHLDHSCRVIHLPHWVMGADRLYFELLESLPWRKHQRWIIDHAVVEPRLSTSIQEPSPEMVSLADALEVLLHRPFVASWANLYRDGTDGVAWHGDRFRPGSTHDDVALVSFGGPRTFRIRPRGGGASLQWTLRSGDLLVMSGPVQQHYEHCIPKVACAGPRISIAFRCPQGREFDQTVVNEGRLRIEIRR
ncbi:MAG TPA: alpha-ketoglutarate-dependent dioxygenase AlkB [Acidimicrobiaceae bacterium]|nr:alpha-ketoglutarate-dependent dioxygenase AlkB [Acidimicrobiaceae bacterium]HCV33205.1 alpha-ketoglutarate-dependent dioxygenase AlkB [Acidimicrobiaceae bacterium]